MSPVDRVTRNPAPLRGNQLANALAKAGVVEPAPAVRPPFVAADVDEAKVLADARVWLARIVSGERVPNSQLTSELPQHRRQAVIERLKVRGLITTRTGAFGGAVATDRLIELARTDIQDEELRALMFEDPIVAAPVATADTMPPPGPGREAWFLERVRTWLARGADGAALRVVEMIPNTVAYHVSPRLKDAGLIERHGGSGSSAWYTVPEGLRDHVRSLTDEQLAKFIWPNRGTLLAKRAQQSESEPPPQPDIIVEAPADEDLDGQISPAMAETLYPQNDEQSEQPQLPQDPMELLAMRYGQIVDVLVRLDARFARLERELGLKPIEQEVTT